jgi:hypothetical protein
MTDPEIPPISVHITGSDIPLAGAPRKKRCRRAFKANTFTLTAANPVQRIFPQADTRVEGWITSAIAAANPPVIYIAGSQSDAQSLGGGAAQVNGTDTAPFPVNTTDAVWASAAAASLPVTISAVAIYEEDE